VNRSHMRKTEEKIIELYSQIKNSVVVGGFYAHYKHPGEMRYKVVSVGLMEDTCVPMVTYEHLKSGVRTVRTLDNFLEKVTVGSDIVDRFTLID
jgi:hypothetical protein